MCLNKRNVKKFHSIGHERDHVFEFYFTSHVLNSLRDNFRRLRVERWSRGGKLLTLKK
jgi:hypothetical protein